MLILFGAILFFLIPEGAAFIENGTQKRIYKGVAARVGQYPFMVYIYKGLNRPNHTFCSGSLIKLDTILTAAHCLIQSKPYLELRPNDIAVLVGVNDANYYVYFRHRNPMNVKYTKPPLTHQESVASQLFIHPAYMTDSDYDLGLIKIAKPFVKTAFVSPIPYTTEEHDMRATCYVIGFGKNHLGTRGILYFFTTRQIKNDMKLCEDGPNPDVYCLKKHRLPEPSACSGDSGGPMLCQGKVYGVYSADWEYTHIDETKDDCGQLFVMLFSKLSASERSQKFVSRYTQTLESNSSDNVFQLYSFFLFVLMFLI